MAKTSYIKHNAAGIGTGVGVAALYWNPLYIRSNDMPAHPAEQWLSRHAIGFFIGLVSEIFKRGWLMVIRSQSRNAREGKEYPLIKARTVVGRAEECDVGLFGDQSVRAMHAVAERRKGKFYILRGEGEVRVNRMSVASSTQLKNGDRLEIGGTLFLFRERAAS